MNAGVALSGKKLFDLRLFKVFGYGHRKRDGYARIVGLCRSKFEVKINAVGVVARHLHAATLAMQRGQSREHQLEVIVHLGHGAHGRARGAHWVSLVNSNCRRDAFDAVNLRLVHAVEKLPCIGREGLDVAALTLGVQRVKHQ